MMQILVTLKSKKDRQWWRIATTKHYDYYMLECSRGEPWTFRGMWDIVRTHKPHILFLSETKINANQVERWRTKLHFAHYFVVEKVGLSSGLALFWGDGLDVRLCSFNKYHINVTIQEEGEAK